MTTKKIYVVASGGGSKISYQAGVIDTLIKNDVHFSGVSGVSAGALVGSMIACGKEDELVDLVLNTRKEDVYKKKNRLKIGWDLIRGKTTSRYTNEPLMELIDKYVHTPTKPFRAGRVCYESKKYVSHVSRENYKKQILASTSIPFLVDPVEIDGKHYVDGGLRNITPIGDILPYDPDLIVIIPTEPRDKKKTQKYTGNLIPTLEGYISIVLDEAFDSDIREFENKNQKAYKGNYKYYRSVILEPPVTLGSGTDFSYERQKQRIELGREVATKYLKKIV